MGLLHLPLKLQQSEAAFRQDRLLTRVLYVAPGIQMSGEGGERESLFCDGGEAETLSRSAALKLEGDSRGTWTPPPFVEGEDLRERPSDPFCLQSGLCNVNY